MCVYIYFFAGPSDVLKSPPFSFVLFFLLWGILFKFFFFFFFFLLYIKNSRISNVPSKKKKGAHSKLVWGGGFVWIHFSERKEGVTKMRVFFLHKMLDRYNIFSNPFPITGGKKNFFFSKCCVTLFIFGKNFIVSLLTTDTHRRLHIFFVCREFETLK